MKGLRIELYSKNMDMKKIFSLCCIGALGMFSGCITVKTHSTIDPIYMTLDVNLKVQLQDELANAFAAIDAASETVMTPKDE